MRIELRILELRELSLASRERDDEKIGISKRIRKEKKIKLMIELDLGQTRIVGENRKLNH